MNCSDGVCGKCHGVKKIVLGALLLLNAFVWPQWTDLTGWISWFAVLMIVVGLLKSFKPSCGHCEAPKKGKK